VVLLVLVGTALACSGDDAGSSAHDALSMRYVARRVECGADQAVDDPQAPGQCITLGDSLFGPSDFTNPIVKHHAALGSGVEVTLTSGARDVLVHDLENIAPNAQTDPDARLTFVFDGRALPWTLLPGPDADLLVVTPSTKLAERIVASLQGP
jgi:hypothetical protein